MRYRTKLYLAFLSISAVSTILAVGIDVFKIRQYLFLELQSKAVSIAATGATVIDGDLLEKIRTQNDESTSDYRQIQALLRKIRDANRRKNTYVTYLYTVYPDPDHPNEFLFGVDAEETEKNISHAGSLDEGAAGDHLGEHLEEKYASKKLTKDQWGVWFTAYAPIYNSRGQYIGTLCVDIGAEFVKSHLDRLIWFAIIGFCAAIFFALFLSTILAKRAVYALNILKQATVEIGHGNLAYRVQLKTNDEFEDLAKSMNQMNEGLEEKERLKTGFARYVSQVVLDKILKVKGSTKLEGEKRKITVLFSDIRNFTRISESMEPEKVFSFLNEYFTAMIDIIFKHNGMLDKMIGDGLMAEFGTPLDDLQQERNAVLTAVEMQKALVALRGKWAKEGKPSVEVGIGIHTGDAIVGTVGSETRMEYTAIGDTVNTASRLENITKLHPRSIIIISEMTREPIKTEFTFTSLGPQILPGKEHPINVYAVEWAAYQGPAKIP